MLALIDDLSDRERLANGGSFFQPKSTDVDGVLRELINTESQNLRALSEYHAAELGLAGFGEEPEMPVLPAPYLSGIREDAASIRKHAKETPKEIPAEYTPTGGMNGEA